MFQIKVKWGKETYDVTVDPAMGVALFKAQLQSLTNVPAERQKIMGVKGGQLRDDADLNDVGLADGKVLMLIGAAAATPGGDVAPVAVAPSAAAGAASTAAEAAAAPAVVPLRKALPTVGLVNVGNTCYMNSCVQVLKATPEATKVFGSATHPLARTVYQLLAMIERSDGSKPIPPVQLWATLISAFPRFGELDDHQHPMQHDAQEAFNALLSTASTTASSTDLGAGGGSAALFTDGELLTTNSLDGSTSREKFNMLTCAITAEVSALETGIQIGLESKMSEGAASASSSASATTTTSRLSRIASLPGVLVVQLSRFAWRADTKQKAKVLRPVTFPTVLDVARWCTPELQAQLAPEREKVKARRDLIVELRRALRLKPEEGISGVLKGADPEQLAQLTAAEDGPLSGYYELYAAISHKGRSADSGHYVAWIKKDDLWYICDDENVGLVSEADVKRLSGVGESHIAYMLFYRARDPRTKQSPIQL